MLVKDKKVWFGTNLDGIIFVSGGSNAEANSCFLPSNCRANRVKPIGLVGQVCPLKF